MTSRPPLHILNLGRVGYQKSLDLQTDLVESRRLGQIPDTILVVEHDPVITVGRGGKTEHLLFSKESLQSMGCELFESGRGGDVTYHGPGQLVCYPIVALEGERQDVRRYVRDLEEAMINAVSNYGIQATRQEGKQGAWVGDRKIGAVGVRISRWVTMHGFALNVTTDLKGFSWIVPCGLHGFGVTSIAQETGNAPPLVEVANTAIGTLAERWQRNMVWLPT